MWRPRLSKRVWTAGVVVTAAVAIIAYLVRPTPIEVETARARLGPLRVTVDAEGKTRVHDRFVIAAPVSGRLARLTLREGAPIRAGQTIAWIAPAPLDEQSRRQAEARVASAEELAAQALAQSSQAQAAAAQARRNLERREALLAAGAISPESREQAALESRSRNEELRAVEARARAAKADIDAARAALVAQSDGIAATIPIRSPSRGRVLRVSDVSERVITAGTPLLEVGDATALEVIVDVLSTEAVQVCAGQAVDLDEWGGERPLRATVRSVEPSAFTKVSALGVEEQRVNVIIDLNDSATMLGDGFRVDVHIVVWEAPNVLQVPPSALIQGASGSWGIYVIEGSRAHLRPVTIGHQTARGVEVISGVSAGAVVVLFPSDQVSDGVRVSQHAQ